MNKFKSKAVQFGNENGYQFVRHFIDYKESEIYVAETSKEIEFTGYPVLIMANENIVRFSEPDETLQLMGIHPAKKRN